jgi:citrate/tricarballylate utilization protein
MHATDALREANRLMTVCNACRYCEGLCAVFPAMEMRRAFNDGDLTYLANLCHQCGACFHDCQYSPPHQFDVNVPRTLARLRNESYQVFARPRAFAGAFENNGVVVTLLTAVSVAAIIFGFVVFADPVALWSRNGGDFYKVMPHTLMVALFGAVSLFAVVAFVASLNAFWRAIRNDGPRAGIIAFFRAIGDTLTLKYLGGGGGGCSSETEQPSARRRLYHQLTFFGFLLCFAATSVATLYHYGFGWPAPYAIVSVPVLLGIAGGIGLLAGPVGLFVLSRRRDAVLTDGARTGMDTAFLLMLFLTSLTGFALMILRDTAAMGLLLALHLGVVLGLFLSMPYGKFVHGLYRFLALVKYAGERRHGTIVD